MRSERNIVPVLILLSVPVTVKFSWTKASINKGLVLHLSSCGLLPSFQSFSWHWLLLENLKVDSVIQPLLELEEGTSRGTIPSCFLQQVFKVHDVLIDHFVSHDTVGQLPIGLLLRCCVGECLPKVMTELDPQVLIISVIYRGYSIARIAITLHK